MKILMELCKGLDLALEQDASRSVLKPAMSETHPGVLEDELIANCCQLLLPFKAVYPQDSAVIIAKKADSA